MSSSSRTRARGTARQRDYGQEYARRVARAAQRGLSRQAGRGHARTPERPSRAVRDPARFESYFTTSREAQEHLRRLASTPDGRRALDEWNLLRNLEGKHEITSDDPGARAGRRQVQPDFEQAESWADPIPIPYVTLFPLEGLTWGVRVQRASRAA